MVVRVQYEFGFRNESVLLVKVGYFKKLCFTNFDKLLNFVIFGNGVPNERGILHGLLNILSILLLSMVNGTSDLF